MSGRPQHSHTGKVRGRSVSRHSRQMGIRLAVSNVAWQMRHGAGKSSDTSASAACRTNAPPRNRGKRRRDTPARLPSLSNNEKMNYRTANQPGDANADTAKKAQTPGGGKAADFLRAGLVRVFPGR